MRFLLLAISTAALAACTDSAIDFGGSTEVEAPVAAEVEAIQPDVADTEAVVEDAVETIVEAVEETATE